MQVRFAGVIPAITTPFRADGEVNIAGLKDNAKWMLAEGATGLVGVGTMGNREPSMRASVTVSKDNGTILIAGVYSESATEAANRAREASDVGADAVMCLPPTSYDADAHELEVHFKMVAEVSDLPIVLYNNPGASKSDLSAETIAHLGRVVPRMVAVKEASGDARRIAHILDLNSDLEVLVGGDDWAREGFAAGATRWISGVAPAACARLYELSVRGELRAAQTLYTAMLPLAPFDMTRKLVQYFKAGIDAVGHVGGPCREPRLPLNTIAQAALEAAVKRSQAHVAGNVEPVG